MQYKQTEAFPPSTPPIPPLVFPLIQIYLSFISLLKSAGIPGMSTKSVLMPDPASGLSLCMLILFPLISLWMLALRIQLVFSVSPFLPEGPLSNRPDSRKHLLPRTGIQNKLTHKSSCPTF